MYVIEIISIFRIITYITTTHVAAVREWTLMEFNASKSEYLTRVKLIDPILRRTKWSVVGYNSSKTLDDLNNCAVREYPTENGPADYALVLDGKVTAIIEAKKMSVSPQEAIQQAERYSKGLPSNGFNFSGFHVPFVYSTNGEKIRFLDIRDRLNLSRDVECFHTPDALREKLIDDKVKALNLMMHNQNRIEWMRYYHFHANKAIEEAIYNKCRELLVAMATGTGKTFMTVSQIYRLMKTGVAKRVLFLVDRRALAAQAVNAFSSFEPEPGKKFKQIYEVYSQKFQLGFVEDSESSFDASVLPDHYLTNPNPGLAFVYVSTIQRMALNLGLTDSFFLADEDQEDAERIEIPIHAFDLIVADECHRGYTSKEDAVWRKTLNHFDAIKIGLTATPAVHTTSYFGEPVFTYEYERAVREGYLVDFDVVNIKSDVRINGVFLKEHDYVKYVDETTGKLFTDELEDERKFDSTEIERKITSVDSNRKILEEIKKYCDDHERKFGRFPKTLVFAVNDIPHVSHADQLVRLSREVFGRGENFVQKITGKVDRPLQKLREFRNRDEIGVIVTVDMLSTGVDIPDLEFIVFLRPVKSRILFEQMLGRGTRLGDKLKGMKSHFTVFDCFDGTLFKYFKDAVQMQPEDPQKESKTTEEIINNIANHRDVQYNTRVLQKRLQRYSNMTTIEQRDTLEAFGVENGDLKKFARELPELLESNFVEISNMLRNPKFVELLESIKRQKTGFIVDETTQDSVSSYQNTEKYEDYLKQFIKFIRENKDKVEAISILQKHPNKWNRQALTEIRNTLRTSEYGFSEPKLREAHRFKYHVELADIISMIKHAISEQEPLLSPEERVKQAFNRIADRKSFTQDQLEWLNRIQGHMEKNLALERGDFDTMPLFENKGGFVVANRVFDGKLKQLIQEINEAVVS